jgi:fucose permease
MILSAMCDNVRGPFIPILKKEFAVNNKGISLMLLACSLGYMSFTFVVVFYVKKWVRKGCLY